LLLFLRIGVRESGIYKEIKNDTLVKKGNFFYLFTNKDRLIKYLKCIAIGLPTWFCIGILALMSNQFAPALGIESINPGKAIMWAYIGISMGDFASGFISQLLKSRKKAIFYMMLFTVLGVLLMLYGPNNSEKSYYFYCAWLGLGTGYWAMFVTVGAEQFGTNIRSTAATTIPNMVRGTLPLMLLAFDYLKIHNGVILAATMVGIATFVLGIYSTLTIAETHNKSLDFTE
jgi:hypothetical protein